MRTHFVFDTKKIISCNAAQKYSKIIVFIFEKLQLTKTNLILQTQIVNLFLHLICIANAMVELA